LFDSGSDPVPTKKDNSPLVSKASEINQRKHRAPQLQKGQPQRTNQGGYGQKYQHKKTYGTPKKDSTYSPVPVKANIQPEQVNPLFYANPLPNLREEGKEMNMQYQVTPEYVDPPPQHNISNYDYHKQSARAPGNAPRQPHEIKKANFEQNRRSNINNISSHIVVSREKRRSDIDDNNLNTRVSHSKNTNKGFVKMTTGPQFGGSQSTTQIPQSYHAGQNEYQQPLQYEPSPPVEQPRNGQAAKRGRNKPKDSILTQYSHNLPPHQVEYKSGFQEIPPPIYNADENMMRRKVQAQPLPDNSDLDDIDYYKDLR